MDNSTQNLYREESNEEAEEEKKPDTFLRVSQDTHEALKEVAEEESRTVKAVTERAIRRGLTQGQDRKAKYTKMDNKGELY